MDKVLYNSVFNRKNSLLPNGTALIQIEAYMRGKKKYFGTNIYITPDQWDGKHRKIKSHPNQIYLNKQITDFINSLENAELQRRQSGKPFSLDYLSEFVKGNCSSFFVEFCKRELKNSQLRNSTKKLHDITIKYLEQFKKDVLFDGVTFEYLTDFERFLLAKGLNPHTVTTRMGIVRRYVNLAIDKDFFDLNKYPFRKYKLKAIKSNRAYLSPEELEKIEGLKITAENEHLQLTLDKFLFSCYTGLRFSDVQELSPKALVIEDGKEWLVLTMQKTDEEIRIPLYLDLFKKAFDIFCNYAGTEPTVFPYQKNATINKHLTEIAAAAEINKKVTFHTARHTQATYLLYKGVSITTVQKLLGHKKLETTQIYSKVMNQTVINELQNVSFSR